MSFYKEEGSNPLGYTTIKKNLIYKVKRDTYLRFLV